MFNCLDCLVTVDWSLLSSFGEFFFVLDAVLFHLALDVADLSFVGLFDSITVACLLVASTGDKS